MQCFVVQSDEIEGRIDPNLYEPNYKKLSTKIKKIKCKALGDIIAFSNETWDQKTFFGDKFPYIEISEIDVISGGIRNIIYYDKKEAPSRARMVVREGDIIISTTRPHRGAISLIDNSKNGFIASTGFAVLRELKTNEINRDFLFYALKADFCLTQMFQRSSGGNYPAITTKELKKIIIPLCSFPIQTQIVDIMQSAYNQKKQKEAKAQKLLDSVDGYVLNELSIKLPEVEERMCFVVSSDEVQDSRVDVEYYQPKFEEIEKGMIKGNFEVKELIDAFEKDLVKGILPNDGEKEGNIKVLQIKNILRNGLIDISGYITAKNIFTLEHKINKGEIIIVITGATIGKVGLWDSDEEFCLGGDMIKFTTNNKFNSYYVLVFLLSQLGQYQLLREITGATNKHLSPNDVKKIQIPLPPLPIQNKIAEEVKRRISEAERLKTEAGKIIEEAKKKVEEMLLGLN